MPSQPSKPPVVNPVNQNSGNVKAGTLQSRASVEQNRQRIFDTNQVQFKPKASGRFGSSGGNNDLVIRFSDGDSGSDSEECRQGKASGANVRIPEVSGIKRPLTSVQKNLLVPQQATRNNTILMPKNRSLSHTCNSSIAKAPSAHPGTVRPYSVWQGPHSKCWTTLKKNKYIAPKEHTSKQDLRQKTILREKEQKPKLDHQKVERNSGPGVISLKHDANGNSRAIPADLDQSDPEKPERKRLKVTNIEVPVVSSNGQLADMVDSNCCNEETPSGKTLENTTKQQKQDDGLAALERSTENKQKEGHDMIPCSQSGRSPRLKVPQVQTETALPTNLKCITLCKNSSTMESGSPSKAAGVPTSTLSKAACELNITSSSKSQACTTLSPDGNMATLHAPLNMLALCNSVEEAKSTRHNMELQSLLELEEKQDMELEEAQEHRRRCEIEERYALKSYRKAQRDLIEANSRCTYLHRQREVYSVRLQSLTMEDSRFLFSSGEQNHIDIGLNSSNTVPNADKDLEPSSNHGRGDQFNCGQPACDSGFQSAEGACLISSDRNLDGQNLGSEACSDPDVSTTEFLSQKVGSVANEDCSPTSIGDDGMTYLAGTKSVKSNSECHRNFEYCEGGKGDLPSEHNPGLSVDNLQDSFVLEELLRSRLLSQRATQSSKNVDPMQIVELAPSVQPTNKNDDGSERSQMSMGDETLSESEKSGSLYHEDELRAASWSPTFLSVSPIVLSAIDHMKVTFNINNSLHIRDKGFRTSSIHNREVTSSSHSEVQPEVTSLESVSNMSVGESGSCTSNFPINPFWPLCMYELRGKCNNDECPCQHLKKHADTCITDARAGPLTVSAKLNCAMKFSPCVSSHGVLSPPTYLKSMGSLKSDKNVYESVRVQSIGRCWQKLLSTSLDLNSPGEYSGSNDPFLHGPDNRFEVYESWKRLSLYFQSRIGKEPLKQGLVDIQTTLEMAFLALQDGDRIDGMTKALDILARGLMTDSTAEILWDVYLHILYGDKKSVGKHDMFVYAVKYNEGSYKLWLMYINSRTQLDERLVAYDTALSALCAHVSACCDAVYASGCILDLFLQMIDCFCMSGIVEKIILKIFHYATDLESQPSLLFPDIFKCLTVSDKCIFWICSIYLVIYKRLPKEMLQQFEFGKELSAIEWPSTDLVTDDDSKRVAKMLDVAIDSMILCINGESNGTKPVHISVQMLAVNHIRCVAAISGLDSCQTLVERYMQLYPSCLELVLTSVRAQKNDFEDSSYTGFEEALSNWPRDVPGAQCIWYQYAEHLLESGKTVAVTELMVRWFHTVQKVKKTHRRNLDLMSFDDADHADDDDDDDGCGDSCGISKTDLVLNALVSNSSPVDVMFGMLNLALHSLLQNDPNEARLAINEALKVAPQKEFTFCVREHATFFITCGQLEDVPASKLLSMLKGYLLDVRASQDLLLSRKFIQDIKKPRVHQLVNSILSPISRDFSLVNMVLVAWYGPSMLPQQFDKLKDLVDFVEAIMDMSPSNYPLAVAVCKRLSERSGLKDVVPANVLFWAALLMVDAIFQAVPVAPEHALAEAADVISNLTDMYALSESFHKRALSVYPFSIKLWKSSLKLSKSTGSADQVVAAAKENGIMLE